MSSIGPSRELIIIEQDSTNIRFTGTLVLREYSCHTMWLVIRMGKPVDNHPYSTSLVLL